MNKVIYLIRHCQATGQAADAPLTAEGRNQAATLTEFLSTAEIGQIVSSSFVRAVESIEPLSAHLSIEIKLDDRLIEAALSAINYSDWLDKLQNTFSDPELTFEGGESSHAATRRAQAAIDDALLADAEQTAIVSHGRLMALILKHFDSKYGFEDWRNLTTPDVFRIEMKKDDFRVQRVWQ